MPLLFAFFALQRRKQGWCDMPLNHYGEDAPRSLSDLVLLELDMKWCRESGTLAPLSVPMQLGAVLAFDDAGRYVPYMTELTPAVEAAEGVEAAPASYADEAVAVLISQKFRPARKNSPAPCSGAVPAWLLATSDGWNPSAKNRGKPPLASSRPWASYQKNDVLRPARLRRK